MLGTYTVSLGSVVAITMGIIMGVVFIWATNWLEKRKALRYEADHARREAEHKDCEQKQLHDSQLNHGRRVYNWLTKQLSPYTKVGIEVRKMEDNGGGFTIEVIRRHVETMRGFDSLVQITYDFVKYSEPYQGHIHYGSCGADLLCYVSDHAPFADLDHLVLREVRLEVERLTKRESAMA